VTGIVPIVLDHWSSVMAALVAAICALHAKAVREDVNACDKRGHDGGP